MQHDDSRERQQASLVGRIISLEAAILLIGLLSLGYGIIYQKVVSIFWGLLILLAFFCLLKVRKKNWKAHWAEMDEKTKKDQDGERHG